MFMFIHKFIEKEIKKKWKIYPSEDRTFDFTSSILCRRIVEKRKSNEKHETSMKIIHKE